MTTQIQTAIEIPVEENRLHNFVNPANAKAITLKEVRDHHIIPVFIGRMRHCYHRRILLIWPAQRAQSISKERLVMRP